MGAEREGSAVVFEGVHCSMSIDRPKEGTIVIVIRGSDIGEFGDAPFRDLARDLAGPPFDLFVDARDTAGATIEVSNDWALWLGRHRERLRSLHMLTGSRYVKLTAGFVRNYAGLGELMRVYTNVTFFEEALAENLRAERSA